MEKTFSEYSIDEWKEIIKDSSNISNIINKLKINRSYHTAIKTLIENNNIDIKHFKTIKSPRKIEELLVENSINVSSKSLKNYLFKNNIIENKCSICNLEPVWNNKPLTLQLDHINGKHYDNRVENLRLLCPNCHTQTDTYTGRNLKQYTVKKCSECDKKLKSDNTTLKCANCISNSKHLCSNCNINIKYNHYSKCKECIELPKEDRKCIYCEKNIVKLTNKEGYHKKCYKNNKILSINKDLLNNA